MTSFWLEYEQAGQIQQAHFEKSTISIGRDRNSDFVLDHPTVSRQHALIVNRGGGVFQLVVLSRGGLTALDQQPVQVPEIGLYDGAMITLGQHTLRFRCPQAIRASGGFAPMPGSALSPSPSLSPSPTPSPAPSGQMLWGNQQASGFGAGPQPQTPTPAEPQTEEARSAGIVSWDEIAASPEALDESEQVVSTDFDRLNRAKSKKKEESNPALVGGAAIIIVGMLVFMLFGGDSNKKSGQFEQVDINEVQPLEVNVRCLDQGSCRRDALRSYALAVDTYESRDVEVSNLFESYRLLMEARAYLESGGITEFPEEMKNWQALHDSTRGELNELFDRFRMQHHQASSRKRYNEMAEVLRLVMAYFPDRTSREYRWARDQETSMRSRGIYPAAGF